jgi:transposase
MPRIAPKIVLDPMQGSQLQSRAQAPSTPQSLALRARIVLRAADGESNQQIAQGLEVPQITVSSWWWRRFSAHGLEGLRDARRAGRPRQHGPEIWQRIQHRLCQPPKFQSGWSVRTLAREVISFLRHLNQELHRLWLLLWDRLNAPRAKRTTQFVAGADHLYPLFVSWSMP